MNTKLKKIDLTSMPKSAKYLNSRESIKSLTKSAIFKKDENSGSKLDIYQGNR